MQSRQINALFAAAVLTCCCWFVVGQAWAADEAGKPTAPEADGEGDTTQQQSQSEKQPKDLLDRLFSPLDEAVSDINRDINKDDENAPAVPSE